MSGNYFSSRTKISLFMLTDNPIDTQGEVGRPSEVVMQSERLLIFCFLSRCDEARPECTVSQTCCHTLYKDS